MGLSGLHFSLKSSFRSLSKVERAISNLERSINTMRDYRLATCPLLYELLYQLSGVNADPILAFTLVSKYEAVLRGIPLTYDEATIDEFTTCISEHGEQTIIDESMSAIAGSPWDGIWKVPKTRRSSTRIEQWDVWFSASGKWACTELRGELRSEWLCWWRGGRDGES